LNKLLFDLDAIESNGDGRVRDGRKALVVKIEGELEKVEKVREEGWSLWEAGLKKDEVHGEETVLVKVEDDLKEKVVEKETAPLEAEDVKYNNVQGYEVPEIAEQKSETPTIPEIFPFPLPISSFKEPSLENKSDSIGLSNQDISVSEDVSKHTSNADNTSEPAKTEDNEKVQAALDSSVVEDLVVEGSLSEREAVGVADDQLSDVSEGSESSVVEKVTATPIQEIERLDDSSTSIETIRDVRSQSLQDQVPEFSSPLTSLLSDIESESDGESVVSSDSDDTSSQRTGDLLSGTQAEGHETSSEDGYLIL